MKDKEENLDKFIKKSIAYYDVQYDEAHWEALEKHLDAEMPVLIPSGSGLHLPSIIISLIGGMVLMLGILWLNGVFENDNEVSKSSFESNLLGEDEPIKQDSELSDGISDQANSNSPSGIKNNIDISIKGGNTSLGMNHLNEHPLKYASSDRQDLIDLSDDGLITKRTIYYMPMSGINSKGFDHLIPVDHDFNGIETYQSNEAPVIQVPDKDEETAIPAKRNNVQFGVSLGFAPDINGVDEPVGKSVSGLVGLQLLATYKQRFGIVTGVYYGKKKYNTEGENYFPPNGYWSRFTNGVVPAEVIGTSAVIDIPVNLTYNWNPHKKLQFITGIGVSSYFILNEDCWYKFDQSNPGTEYGWDTEEMVKQMWGVGNVSVGALWYLKPKINIRVEPYLKVPFSDFGWGRINLYSAGTLISIQYTFN